MHHPLCDNALREILVRRPDAHLLHSFILGRNVSRGSERVIGLELDHRPDNYTHRGKRLLEREELRAQDWLDAGAGFVVWPQTVAERLDDVVSRNSDMCRSIFEHFRDATKHARHRAVRGIGF